MIIKNPANAAVDYRIEFKTGDWETERIAIDRSWHPWSAQNKKWDSMCAHILVFFSAPAKDLFLFSKAFWMCKNWYMEF